MDWKVHKKSQRKNVPEGRDKDMEVKMNKEIRNYSESVFFGLDFRQCFFSALAVLAAIGIYFGVRDVIAEDFTGWLCILGAAPFAACGFFKYHGMTAEQFLWAVIKSEFLYPKRLLFQPENLYYTCLEECVQAGEQTGKDGAKIIQKSKSKAQKKMEKKPVKKKGRGNAFD